MRSFVRACCLCPVLRQRACLGRVIPSQLYSTYLLTAFCHRGGTRSSCSRSTIMTLNAPGRGAVFSRPGGGRGCAAGLADPAGPQKPKRRNHKTLTSVRKACEKLEFVRCSDVPQPLTKILRPGTVPTSAPLPARPNPRNAPALSWSIV